ncbi:hypothetical protein HFN63_35310 [Rhizobium leguminosarum]|uniref:hypothetical protein n=1 Tax=Rhizobium leguminosarum TaxID=384 RepID=UPI001C98803E|nr:hypothetical protein [Rhizobium leguminosarum]MBY5775239.1 hypothetical protein [Rhizobium leguminosarum]
MGELQVTTEAVIRIARRAALHAEKRLVDAGSVTKVFSYGPFSFRGEQILRKSPETTWVNIFHTLPGPSGPVVGRSKNLTSFCKIRQRRYLHRPCNIPSDQRLQHTNATQPSRGLVTLQLKHSAVGKSWSSLEVKSRHVGFRLSTKEQKTDLANGRPNAIAKSAADGASEAFAEFVRNTKYLKANTIKIAKEDAGRAI